MRVKSLNENHLVISQSFSGVCVIVLALLSSALFQIVLRAEKMTIGLHLVSFAPFVFLFGIGLTMLRSLELKEDGIYIIIAVKNQEERIEGFLRSILFKILYGKEEFIKDIIVTDLNSTDNTKEIVKKMSIDYEYVKVTNWKECKDIIDNIDEVDKKC